MSILKVGKTIVLRHSAPFCEEPHQVYGTIKEVTPNITLTDRIRGRRPVDVVVATEEFGLVRVKRVRPDNIALVFDPWFLK